MKNVRFLYSFNIPDRSYFFLNRLRALSIDSLSPMEIPTKFYSPRFNFDYVVNDSINFFCPDFWNSTEMECFPSERISLEITFP